MKKEELIEKIKKEMGQWYNYYNSCDEFQRIKLRALFELPEDADGETISKAISECEDSSKEDEIDIINSNIEKVRFEAQIAIRTLNWVYNILVPQIKEEDSE